MPKHAQILPGHGHAIPSKRPEEAALASDRAQPLAPSAILQRAALAPQSLRPGDIHRLQQTLGNRAVGALLSQLSPARSLVQAKLTVHAAGDQYEQEADRMAEAVTGMPAAQREELSRAEKPAVMRMPQPSPAAGGAFEASGAFEQQLQAARGRGQPLPPALKEDFETKFGADFGGVRVHADAHAGELNRSIAADAFTAGRDVFFRQGVYDPGSRDGQKLIAHELTHVLQQAADGAAVRSIQRKWVYINGELTWVPDDDAETQTEPHPEAFDWGDLLGPAPTGAPQIPQSAPVGPSATSEQSKTDTPPQSQQKRYGHDRHFGKPGQEDFGLPVERLPRLEPPKQTLFAPLQPSSSTDAPQVAPRLRKFAPITVKRQPEPGSVTKVAETRQPMPTNQSQKALPSLPEPKPRLEEPKSPPQTALSGGNKEPATSEMALSETSPTPLEPREIPWRPQIKATPRKMQGRAMKPQDIEDAKKISHPDEALHTYKDIYDLKSRWEDAAWAAAKRTAAKNILAPEQLAGFESLIADRRKKSLWLHTSESIEPWLKKGNVKNLQMDTHDEDEKERVRKVVENKYQFELALEISNRSGKKIEPRFVMDVIKDEYILSLNKRGWRPIQKEIKLENKPAVINTMTPVNKSFGAQFEDYGESGWASMARNLPVKAGHTRATNLWHSQLSTGDTSEPIFEAFRSGSIAASGVGTSEQQKIFSEHKALEILRAAAVHKLKSEGGGESKQKPLQVDVVSISLQTPTNFPGMKEKKDVKLQTAALQFWNDKTDQVIGPDRRPRFVKYNVTIFNTGVNAAAGVFGEDFQNQINQGALEKFVGVYQTWKSTVNTQPQTPELQAKLKIVETLMEDIRGHYRAKMLDIKDYELPAKIANAAYLMGHIVQFNCKSGKDRTSAMDIESKFMAMRIQERTPEDCGW